MGGEEGGGAADTHTHMQEMDERVGCGRVAGTDQTARRQHTQRLELRSDTRLQPTVHAGRP